MSFPAADQKPGWKKVTEAEAKVLQDRNSSNTSPIAEQPKLRKVETVNSLGKKNGREVYVLPSNK